MSESAFLKEDLGPVLAKGLAAVSIARPANPTEYLALWLLHYLQQRERRTQEVESLKQLEADREEWAKGRAQREKAATSIIQREWKAHVRAVEDEKRRQATLREAFARVEETLDERFQEETAAEAPDKPEAEREAEQARYTWNHQFNRGRAFVAELDKSYAADLKKIPSTNKHAMTVLKCCFYVQGLRPRQLDTPEKVKALIKPYPFTQFLQKYHPVGSPLEKKRNITRARRLLSKVNEDAVKKTGPAIHAVFSWLNAAVNFRAARDEFIRIRKAAGKEADEEYEEEEEVEDEEKDPEEELVKAEELERQRALEAQRAAEAAEEVKEE